MSFTTPVTLSSLNGTNGFRLDGGNNTTSSGYSVASAGDVNGDGFADIIVGAPYSYSPNVIFEEAEGSSYVVFGRSGGWTSTINLSSLNGSNGFRLNGVASGDASGFSVASAGDVNGDGLADLIVGALEADPNGSGSGSSYVVFGRSSGWGAAVNLSSLNGTDGFRLDGAAATDRSGYSVASAGDVNGDGLADVIVGAIGAQPNGRFSGSSYVVFGQSSGWGAAINLSGLNGTTGFRLDGVAAVDQSGRSVASAGDVNGDGFADLIVGADNAAANGGGSGASYVVFGRASGWGATINLSGLNGSGGFRLGGAAAGDLSGRSVASAGDVNGDGFADLIVGADGADPNGNASGSSYVVFGRASGWGGLIPLSSLDGTTGFRLDGAADGDSSGYSVASAGDVNGDGFADLIVGAYLANPNGNDSGSSYVVFGRASGWASAINLSSLTGAEGFRLDGVAADDRAGSSVASAGDVDGDGFADLIIGAWEADPNGILSAGSTYVYFSPAAGGATYRGTTLADVLRGTPNADVMNGYGRSDRLSGQAGDDTIDGGTGNDVVDGGTGSDTASFATAGAGIFYGLLAQGSGFNTRGAGIDTLTNFENLTGGAFGDTLGGDTSANLIDGGNGDDLLFGWVGDDTVLGGAGNDTLDGGTGNDSLVGGTGDDSYVVDALGDLVVELAGEGSDSVFVSVDGWTVSVDLEAIYLFGGATSLTGGTGADVLVANASLGSVLSGGQGDDTLWGQADADSLLGGAGDDVLRGGGGNDTLHGGAGNDQLVGGSAADTFRFDATGWGYDQIFDFVVGTDKINLAGAASGYGQLTVYGAGGSTVVLLGTDRIDVYGVALTQGDFLFA